MADRLKREIKQTRPFASLESEAFLNVMRTNETLMEGLAEVLKPAGLSPTSYNVLRILRGAGATCCEAGLACREVASRMVTRDPDMTRLLDRLEKRNLIMRQRQTADRRVVNVAVTEAGRTLLDEIDPQVLAVTRRLLAGLSKSDLTQLITLLEKVRESLDTDPAAPPATTAHPDSFA